MSAREIYEAQAEALEWAATEAKRSNHPDAYRKCADRAKELRALARYEALRKGAV